MAAYSWVDYDTAGKSQNQNINSKTLKWVVDFTKRNMANTDTLTVGTIPKGFVLERRDVILNTAEGSAATIELGISGTTGGLITSGSVNGTVNTAISTAQSIAAGKWFTSNTDLLLTSNSTIAAAKITIILRGYILPA